MIKITSRRILLFTLAKNVQGTLYFLGLLLSLIFLGLVVNYVLFKILSRLQKKTKSQFFLDIVNYLRNPGKLFFPVFFIILATPYLKLPFTMAGMKKNLFHILFIISLTWLAVRGITIFQNYIYRKYSITVKDNLKARQIQTLFKIIKRVLLVIIFIIALSAILINFETVRRIGLGILASAGLIGIIIGFAAQKSFANLLAGIQIAITQPIRINDAVVIEGEWGWIEEITLTYVVVKIWDLRRLVLPITYFIEKPFQNWTRISADILGAIYLYLDYRVPVNEVREELHTILKGTDFWDGKAWVLQVTDLKEQTVELRALMSASDSPTAWNLRCHVREKLLEFLQKKYPLSLPRLRVELFSPIPELKT